MIIFVALFGGWLYSKIKISFKLWTAPKWVQCFEVKHGACTKGKTSIKNFLWSSHVVAKFSLYIGKTTQVQSQNQFKKYSKNYCCS